RDREDAVAENGRAPYETETGAEPVLAHAAADFDGGSVAERAPEEPRVSMPVPEEIPPSVSAAPEPMMPPAAEMPRRRSTVREAAPAGLTSETAAPVPAHPSVEPMPPPEPAVSSANESTGDDRPRRSGWWSKRALGKE